MGLLSSDPLWEKFATRTLYLTGYGGADFGECQATIARIGDGGTASDWHREWTATADRLDGQAAHSASRGHTVSARDAYLRAAVYHRTAYLPLYGEPVDPRLVTAFEASMRDLTALVELSPGLEQVEIQFGRGSLPGLLATPDTPARGTIVYTSGYDSDLVEMLAAHVPAALARGYRILLFDGPGQGRNLIRDGIPLRPDWENVARPVLDWMSARPGVDPDRLVLAGWSLGGFLAARAAAFAPRLAALVADPGAWDQRDTIVGRLPLSDAQKASFPHGVDPHLFDQMAQQLASPQGDPVLRWTLLQRGLWVNGQQSLFGLLSDLSRYTLSDVAHRIACPTLLTFAEDDPLSAGAPTLFEALKVERRELVHFTTAEGAGGHCEGAARRLYHQRVYDWLDETID